ncbi:hypothetical protein SNEBB_003278 [Seison nebaliae]|nr:hypothetical protein SNEBB_003278 [Seison nebaliae]
MAISPIVKQFGPFAILLGSLLGAFYQFQSVKFERRGNNFVSEAEIASEKQNKIYLKNFKSIEEVYKDTVPKMEIDDWENKPGPKVY